LHVTFAEYLFYRALLQKRPIILRSLLIAASPKNECNSLPYASEHNRKLALFEIPRINMFFHVLVFPNVCLGSQRLMRQNDMRSTTRVPVGKMFHIANIAIFIRKSHLYQSVLLGKTLYMVLSDLQ